MALGYAYPKRLSREDVVATVIRHGFKAGNASVAVQRIKKLVDDDGHGRLRLLAPGMKKVEQLMSKHL